MALLPVWGQSGDYFIPFRLLLLSRMIERETSRDLSRFSVTVAEWRVLSQCCSMGSSSAAEICAAFEADRAEVSRAVAGLLKAGLIQREPDSSHRQKMRITPTDAGWEIFEGVRVMRDAYFNEILQDLDPDERKAFNAALHSIAVRVDEQRTLRAKPAEATDHAD